MAKTPPPPPPAPFTTQEALEILGIRQHFKGVFGAAAMGDTCKPDREAFDIVLEAIGADPTKTGERDHARVSVCATIGPVVPATPSCSQQCT